jgi:hypothetical protein
MMHCVCWQKHEQDIVGRLCRSLAAPHGTSVTLPELNREGCACCAIPARRKGRESQGRIHKCCCSNQPLEAGPMWGRASHHAPLHPARLPRKRRMALPTFLVHREKTHAREATAWGDLMCSPVCPLCRGSILLVGRSAALPASKPSQGPKRGEAPRRSKQSRARYGGGRQRQEEHAVRVFPQGRLQKWRQVSLFPRYNL